MRCRWWWGWDARDLSRDATEDLKDSHPEPGGSGMGGPNTRVRLETDRQDMSLWKEKVDPPDLLFFRWNWGMALKKLYWGVPEIGTCNTEQKGAPGMTLKLEKSSLSLELIRERPASFLTHLPREYWLPRLPPPCRSQEKYFRMEKKERTKGRKKERTEGRKEEKIKERDKRRGKKEK